MQFRFSDCQLDPHSRQLLRGDRPVHLTPKAFEVLSALLEARPRAVAKAELLQRAWADTSVGDSSLARIIMELREALGDDAQRPTLIRTVHAFGYAFDGAVTERPDQAARPSGSTSDCYWIMCGSRDFSLNEGENIIGRDDGVAVQLRSPDVSRRHARVLIADGRATIEDLGSRNGTLVRGQKLATPATLDNGEEFTLGSFRLTYRILRATDQTEAQT